MSYDEMLCLVCACQKRDKLQMQQKASLDFQLAYLITIGFNNPKKFPTKIQDAYPSLFDDKDGQADAMVHYEQMKKFAQMHNLTHNQGGESSKNG